MWSVLSWLVSPLYTAAFQLRTQAFGLPFYCVHRPAVHAFLLLHHRNGIQRLPTVVKQEGGFPLFWKTRIGVLKSLWYILNHYNCFGRPGSFLNDLSSEHLIIKHQVILQTKQDSQRFSFCNNYSDVKNFCVSHKCGGETVWWCPPLYVGEQRRRKCNGGQPQGALPLGWTHIKKVVFCSNKQSHEEIGFVLLVIALVSRGLSKQCVDSEHMAS